jgi:hypothetical protein
MAESQNNVNTPCLAWTKMSAKWDLLHDLLGGTQAMRVAGIKWLPKEQDELELNYAARLARSVLFGAYSDTIEKLAAKPLSEPITIQGEPSDRIKQIVTDVDGSGYSLQQFAKDAFRSAAIYGLAHVLVDYPKSAPGVDLGTERQLALQPKFVLVEPPNLIGWEVQPGSTPKLSSVRIHETTIIADGAYGQKVVNRIRVYSSSTWELWEQTKDNWIKIEEGPHSYPGVPLRTCYFLRRGFMVGDPPLEDLAWLNLAHWQSSSDQRNILRFARAALLFGKGLKRSDVDKGITIGGNLSFLTENDNAELKYVEHSGKAIEAGAADVKQIEERMEVLGMQPMIRQSGDVKATGQAINESKVQSEIQAWIHNLEGALLDCFTTAAQWIGETLPDKFKIDIYNEFTLLDGSTADNDQLLKARVAGEISRKTYLNEIKRRGLLSENLDVAQEIEDVNEEGPALAGIGSGAGDNGGQQ